MSEYSIGFAQRLIESAEFVERDGLEDQDAGRAVLYLSLLAAEIALKAMLEKAGVPIATIRSHSHRLHELLVALDRCSVAISGVGTSTNTVSASRVRALEIMFEDSRTTVGAVLEAEQVGASPYPNHVRYGSALRHFPPTVVVAMARHLITFAREHWQSLSQ